MMSFSLYTQTELQRERERERERESYRERERDLKIDLMPTTALTGLDGAVAAI
jgi:hypothetical protein